MPSMSRKWKRDLAKGASKGALGKLHGDYSPSSVSAGRRQMDKVVRGWGGDDGTVRLARKMFDAGVKKRIARNRSSRKKAAKGEAPVKYTVLIF